MHYKNGDRTFKTKFNIYDARGYCLVEDADTQLEFYLPEKVIRDMTYVFSWDRYHEDMNKDEVIASLKAELCRLQRISFVSTNVEKGKLHIVKFLQDLEFKASDHVL